MKPRHFIPAAALVAASTAALGAADSLYVDADTVRQAQRVLGERGFHAGAADGTITAQTRAALKEFQKSENLQDTGHLNPGTLAALGVPADQDEHPPASLVLSSAKVRALQAKLNERGFNVGLVDGRMGDATRAAIRAFQRSQDLPVTGRADSRTLAALGVSGPLAARD